MSLLRQGIKSTCASLLPRRFFFTHGKQTGNQIALTFDDGPDHEFTPLLLDLLQKENVRATFFVIGKKAEQHPHLIERMAREGHEIGNHTYSHSEPRETSTQKLIDEIRQTDNLIEKISHRPCRWMRPPKGELNVSKMFQLWKEKQTVALWSVDSKDYLMQSTAEAITWAKAYKPTSGDILLMHDNYPYAIHMVKELLQQQKQQWNFVTLTGLITDN